MSLKTTITDGHGTGNTVKVNGEGELSVVVHPHPPIDEKVEAYPFRQYFTNDGTATGLKSMAVDGSINTKEFYVKASQDFDIYIKYISAEIGDGGSPSLNKFGALSALTNGVEFIWFNNIDGEYELHEGIKTNKEFIRIGTDTPAIGTGVEAFLADVSGGGTEKSYLPAIDFTESYGLTWGIRLRKSSTDRIIFRVRDNLSGLTTFNIVCYGIRLR